MIDIREYKLICRDFGVDKNTSWGIVNGVNIGLERVYSVKGLLDAGWYDSNKMSFTQDGDGVNNLGRNGSMKVNIKKQARFSGLLQESVHFGRAVWFF